MAEVLDLECTLAAAGTYEPQLQWAGGNKQWLIEIGAPDRKVYLPGRLVALEAEKLERRSDILILSERSGGSKSLLKWWEGQISTPKQQPWVHIDAGLWRREHFQPATPPVENEALTELERLGEAEDRLEGTRALEAFSKKHTQPLTLFLRDLPQLGERAVAIASALRVFREANQRSLLRVVLISHQETFADTVYYQSGYLPLLWQLKTRGFEVGEIAILAQAWSEKPELIGRPLKDISASDVHEFTGGQPLLVQRLFDTIAREEGFEKLDSQAALAKATKLLRRDPPEACRFWQRELETALKFDVRLEGQLHSYIRGATLGPARFPPPAYERSLYVAGWLGLDRLGRWGIRSALHADLARQVLNMPASGKEAP